MIAAIIIIGFSTPKFLSVPSIVNIISLSASNLPIALGIAGCIILTGTDLSAGRIVGACSRGFGFLLQASSYANKMFPNIGALPRLGRSADCGGDRCRIRLYKRLCTATSTFIRS